jgi:hypothetical protein
MKQFHATAGLPWSIKMELLSIKRIEPEPSRKFEILRHIEIIIS